jgi:hypothetical protein
MGSALVVLVSSCVYAQSKTVTNADLEKYRSKRIAAEKDLRDNYEKLGFPSPEELEKMNRESRLERAALDRRLREEEVLESEAGPSVSYYQTIPSIPVYPYPNPSFVDYGGRYAPSYLYYRYYSPRYRYPVGRGHAEPRRFSEFRRQWRNATKGNHRNQE